jgi:acyl-coenzyme A thioesterase PaaI-like protein
VAEPVSVDAATFLAMGRAIHVSRTQAVWQCDVFAVIRGDEKVCAVAQSTMARLPAQPDSA